MNFTVDMFTDLILVELVGVMDVVAVLEVLAVLLLLFLDCLVKGNLLWLILELL